MKKLLTLTLLFISLISSNLYAINPESLLKPDKAFQASIETSSADSITATWKIADGYYMYRKQFSFSSDDPNIVFGKPEYPEGKLKKDPSLGNVVIYRDHVSIKIPITNKGTTQDIQLKTKSQGCADRGVCYPPQKITLLVNVPTTTTDTISMLTSIAGIANAAPVNSLSEINSPTLSSISGIATPSSINSLAEVEPSSSINGLDKTTTTASTLAIDLGIEAFGKNTNTGSPLPPDEAFAFDISALDKQTLNAHWQITPDHYLYKKKIRFRALNAQGIELGEWIMPEGIRQKDPTYGNPVVYTKDFEVRIPLIGKADSITIKTSYQGCAKLTGICYPPQNKTQTINLAAAPKSSQTKNTNSLNLIGIADKTSAGATTKISEQAQFTNILKDKSLLTILGLFFLAGLALTFTPCVFPMIPILSGIISGQGTDISKKKAFMLSLAYVIPMALTYAIVGVLAGLSGESLTAALQTPWVIATFALLFVALAFAMFGFYELQMPSGIQNKLASFSNQQKSGSFIGAAIMGVLSALIVGPCVTAPLTGALIFIADTKDALLGGLSLFMLGIGMGVPLLMIGTAAGEILPKAGAWMDKVKAVFGVLMLGLSIWMLERILPVEIIILLTAALLIGSAIYMKAIDTLDSSASGWDRLWKALGILLLIYGTLLIIGISKGNSSFFAPLKEKTFTQQIGSSTEKHSESLAFTPIKGIKGLNLALDNSSTNNKPLMLDFYADWCISCKEMEHKVFTDPRVIKALEGTILVQADVTKNDEQDSALMKKFGLFGPPGILFFDTKKQEYRPFRVVGEMSADNFFAHITEFLQQKK
ncbi:MAG: protein-disulfide reductase DsbD [Cocleimonas sp.]|nr:protein-disulfide reductase DsbD [Cocleimonas sp.]